MTFPSPPGAIAPARDEVRRFIIENKPVRGHWVRLEGAWRDLRAHREYPQPVRELLGQAVVASVLLAATLKFRGTLTLQLQGDGIVSLLVAQCTHDYRVRAVATVDEAQLAAVALGMDEPAAVPPDPRRLDALFRKLVGAEGRLAVTIEAEERAMRYQGIVPLTGANLAECLETYFQSSEQLPTHVRLAADDEKGGGLLVQQLPEGEAAGEGWGDADGRAFWNQLGEDVSRVTKAELLANPADELIKRALPEQDIRLFKATPVEFECRCSLGRVAGLLRGLGEAEVRDVLQEQGAVTVTCEFCSRPYRFDAVDVDNLFTPAHIPPDSYSLH